MKRAFLLAWLGLFAAWPLVHHVLVDRGQVDPWKLGGWSMYSVPVGPPRLVIEGIRGGRAAEIEPSSLPPEVLTEFGRYSRWRLALPQTRPERAARALLAAAPELDAVRLTVREARLDRDTARLRWSEVRLRYDRE